MRILVTGGAGFIGSNFIRFWIEKHPKDRIVNLDKLTYAGHLSSLKDLPASRHRLVRGDICNANIVDTLVKNIDVIVHFAAESHVDRSIIRPGIFVRTNVVGTQVLLEAAVRHKVSRFHHISTDEVFGSLALSSTKKFSETTPYDPHSPYSASKAAADHLVRSYFHTFGLPITLSNCSNNYGPFQDPEKFIPRMITNLAQGKKIKIYGDGLYIRDWLFVTDHCRAIESIILKGKPGETYCVGGQHRLFNNLQIARKVISHMQVTPESIEFVQDRPGHDRKYAIDWSKISDKLGWEPQTDIDQGLRETIAWYTQNSSWWKPLKTRAESIYSKNP